jgi:hypothetical protein
MPTEHRLTYTVMSLGLALLVSLASGCGGGRGHAAPRPLASLVIVPIAPPRPVVEPKTAAERALPGAPDILPRSSWAVKDPIAPRLEPMGQITRMTIHHEGMDVQGDCSATVVKDELRRIQQSHEDRMHAGDIGYHYIIDYSGRIWEGRSLKYQGAHAGNGDANRGNIGIVLMGNFDVQRPTRAQLSSLTNLVEYLAHRYNIPVDHVYTHREIRRKYDLGDTDCPGKYLQQQVDLMRKILASAQK